MKIKTALLAAGIVLFSGVQANAATTELITNGSFETGDFTGWTATVAPGSAGDIQVITGDSAPASGFTVTGASDGDFHAVTGQTFIGAYSLIQSFVMPTLGASDTLSLTFDMFSVTDVGLIDGGLDPFGQDDTELSRVDILSAGAGAFDEGASIVATLLAPFVDGPFATTAYTSYVIALEGIAGLVAGDTYQLRFAQADNSGNMSMGVDNVSLVANVSEVPVPAALPLLISGLGGIILIGRRRKRAA